MVWLITLASLLGFLAVDYLSKQPQLSAYDSKTWLMMSVILAVTLLAVVGINYLVNKRYRRHSANLATTSQPPAITLVSLKLAAVFIFIILLSASFGLYQQQRVNQRLLTAPITIDAVIKATELSDNTSLKVVAGNDTISIGSGYYRQIWQIVDTQVADFNAPSANFQLPMQVMVVANINEHPEWEQPLASLQPTQLLNVKIALQPISQSYSEELPHYVTALRLGFDEQQWLKQRGVQATATLISIQKNSQKNSPKNNLNNYSSNYRQSIPTNHIFDRVKIHIDTLRWQYRQKIVHNLERQLVKQALIASSIEDYQRHLHSHAILLGLLTGDKGLLDNQLKMLYQVTGISHLLAISGPHVLMLASVISMLVLWLVQSFYPTLLCRLSSRLLILWVSVGVAGWYALLVGFEIPAQRTFWMLLLLTLSRQWLVNMSAYQLLAWVGVLMMWADTTAVWQAGFWLSFVAVGLLLRFSEQVGTSTQLPLGELIDFKTSSTSVLEKFGYIVHYLCQQLILLLKLQLWLFIWLMPIVLWFFGKLSLIGIMVNLFAVPFLGIVIVPLDILAGVIAWLPVVGTWLSQQLWSSLAWLLDGFHVVLAKIVTAGYAKQWYISLNQTQLLLCGLILIIWGLRGVFPRIFIVPLLLMVVILPIEQNRATDKVPTLSVLANPKLMISLLVKGEDSWLILADNQLSTPNRAKKASPFANNIKKSSHFIDLSSNPTETTYRVLNNDIYPLLAQQQIKKLTGVISQTPSPPVNDIVQKLATTIPINQYWLAGFDSLQPTSTMFEFSHITAKTCQAAQTWQHNDLQITAITGWQLALPMSEQDNLATQTCQIQLQHHPKHTQPFSTTLLASSSAISLQMSEKLCTVSPSDLLIQPYQMPILKDWLTVINPSILHILTGNTDYQQPNESSQLNLLTWQAVSNHQHIAILQSHQVGNLQYQLIKP